MNVGVGGMGLGTAIEKWIIKTLTKLVHCFKVCTDKRQPYCTPKGMLKSLGTNLIATPSYKECHKQRLGI